MRAIRIRRTPASAPESGGKIAGLWHAHVGWLFRNVGRAEWTKYAKDLLADRGMVFVSRTFGLWVALSLLLPFAAGWLWGGTFGAGLQAMFWGGADPDLPAPPHHVVGQLGLPLRRDRAASESRTSRGTSGGSPGSRSASRGITTITPSPPRRSMA